jgi:multidrug resistance efflux pump
MMKALCSFSGLDQVVAPGVVEAVPREMALRPEIAGRIARLHAQENQVVIRGALLVELHHERQSHQLALAEAERDLAWAQFKRLGSGELPDQRCARAVVNRSAGRERSGADAAWMGWAQARRPEAPVERASVSASAEVAAAQARVAAAEARLLLTQMELARTLVRAPATGCLLQLFVKPGAWVSPASLSPMLLFADLSRRCVRACVEEPAVGRLKVGQSTLITTESLPGKVFTGQVARLVPRLGTCSAPGTAPNVSKDSSSCDVLIDLAEGEDLLPTWRVQTRILLHEELPGRSGPAPPGTPSW